MINIKTLVLAIAVTVLSASLGALYIAPYYIETPCFSITETLTAIAVISALYGAIAISSLILVRKMRKEKEKKADVRILSAIAVISALLAVFFFSLLILLPKGSEVPEKTVYKIKDEATKKDLIERGLYGKEPPPGQMAINPDGSVAFINITGIKELVEKGVYKLSPDGTIEMNMTA
ncbi:MAG TPA: hypothetical protein HA348_06245 [Thermoplasmata archaeon]|nr:hypothetical protein [Thermoplasmata archaeon]